MINNWINNKRCIAHFIPAVHDTLRCRLPLRRNPVSALKVLLGALSFPMIWLFNPQRPPPLRHRSSTRPATRRGSCEHLPFTPPQPLLKNTQLMKRHPDLAFLVLMPFTNTGRVCNVLAHCGLLFGRWLACGWPKWLSVNKYPFICKQAHGLEWRQLSSWFRPKLVPPTEGPRRSPWAAKTESRMHVILKK